MPSRREQVTAFKRNLIADAAHRLFLADAYETVSVDQIAREADMGKGTLYYYFESKEEILAYIISCGLEQLCTKIEQVYSQSDDYQVLWSKLIDLQYEYFMDYNQLFISLLRRKDKGDRWNELMKPIRISHQHKQKLVGDILQQGMDQGFINPQDIDRLARGINNMIKGFSLESAETRRPEDKESNLSLLKSLLLTGLWNHKKGE